jgi:MFS transporter, ACS family, DAL5 transporter family protein
MIIAYTSDKARHRFAFAIFPLLVCITGFAMLLSIHNNRHAEYTALFLVSAGAYSAMPIIVCWYNMNLGGHHRRAVGTAWQIGFGNTGGIIGKHFSSLLPFSSHLLDT